MPTLTSTPIPDTSKLSKEQAREPTINPKEMPTLTPTPIPDTSKLSREILMVLDLGVVSAAPSRINLYFSVDPQENDAVQQYLRNQGATITYSEPGEYTEESGTSVYGFIEAADVPVLLIPALSNLQGFVYAFTDYHHYGTLSFELSNLVMEYEAGYITALEAARNSGAQWADGELITLLVDVESCENVLAVVEFHRKTFGLNPGWYDADETCYGSSFDLYGYVSINVEFSDLLGLSRVPGVLNIRPQLNDPQWQDTNP